jgi:hypothetical protein
MAPRSASALGLARWSVAVGLLATVAGCGGTASSISPAISGSGEPSSDPVAPLAASPTSPVTPPLQRGPAHPDRATIIDGSWLIGSDYPPALYMVPTSSSRCHWRIVDYATGSLIEEGRYSGPGPAALWVGDGDLFQSEGCLLWQGFPQLTGSRDDAAMPTPTGLALIADGRWEIGAGARPGRYRSDRRAGGPCSYRVDRADDRDDESYESTGTVRSIPAYLDLTLVAGDVFITKDCGQWRLLE